MGGPVAALRPAAPWRPRLSVEALASQGGLVAFLAAAAAVVAVPALLRPALALVLVLGLGIAAIARPQAALVGLLAWLLVLGSARRIVTGVSPSGESDVLLLVGPIALVSLVIASKPLRAHLTATPLSRAVALLSTVVFVSAFNPAQGSVMGGVAGLIYTFVPTLAFWIGRAIDDRTLRRVLGLVTVAGVAAAAYGLFQQFVGFPWWDQRWIQEDGYLALNVGKDITRSFAMFASSQEYATVLSVGLVMAGVFLGRRLPLFLAVGGLLAVTLVLSAARTPVVMVLVTAGLLVATRLRLPLPAVAAAGTVALVVLFVGAGHLAGSTTTSGAAAPFVDRQLEGLANPLDAEKSTASVHYGYFAEGIVSAFTQPLGQGLGVISVAGSKFDAETKNTEYDPSNMAVAAGLPGLVAYLAVAVLGLRLASRLAREHPEPLRLAAFGLLTVLFTQWLNGGLYAISVLPWLVLGWADRRAAAPA